MICISCVFVLILFMFQPSDEEITLLSLGSGIRFSEARLFIPGVHSWCCRSNHTVIFVQVTFCANSSLGICVCCVFLRFLFRIITFLQFILSIPFSNSMSLPASDSAAGVAVLWTAARERDTCANQLGPVSDLAGTMVPILTHNGFQRWGDVNDSNSVKVSST